MIEAIRQIAREAGAEILNYYGKACAVETKADNSPLTQADRAAHDCIVRRLGALDPGIPVLSEESEPKDIAGRKSWTRFWLVDPLDGTKEFLKGTGEFTVNIALVEDGMPVLGVVYAPVREWTYFAGKGRGAWKRMGDHAEEPIRVRPAPAADHSASTPVEARLAIVASRDHAGPLVKKLLERYPGAEAKSMGSSLKFCLVAEGAADVYLRDGPTMEWDTGAAQCIVEAAGGNVLTLDGVPLAYNKDDLRNRPLLTVGEPAFASRVLSAL